MTSPAITADSSGTCRLGDLTVRRLGFGAMRLPAAAETGAGGRARAHSVLRRAVGLGVNHIDTAAFYFSPRRAANELINSALAPYPDDLVLATKVWPGRDPSGAWEWAEPAQIRGQVEENLRQLGRDHLDLVNLRLPPSRRRANGSLAEHFGALADCRTAGLVRHLGVSNVSAEQLAEAREIAPVVCVQNAFGVGAADEERELLRSCGEQGIAYVPFFAIAGEGREAGAPDTDTEAVRAAARARGLTPAQIRLAWTLHQGPHVLAIPGTGNPDHVTENVAAGAVRLTDEEARLLG